MVTVVPLVSANEKTAADIDALARELHLDGSSNVSLERIREVLADAHAVLMTAQDEGRIVGMATLYILPTTEKRIARVDDVVVLAEYRGQGLGERLMRAVIDVAKERGVSSLHLTSRPARVAAQKLYEKVGFKKRATDAFKLSL